MMFFVSIWVKLAIVIAVVIVIVTIIKKNNKAKEAKIAQEEERRRQEYEKQEKERKEKYKNDILSGAISYEKEVQEIANKISKFKSVFKEELSEVLSIIKEWTNQTSTGSWDTTWYTITIDKIKSASLTYPPDVEETLSNLREIKQDPIVAQLESEYRTLKEEWIASNGDLQSLQFRLRMS